VNVCVCVCNIINNFDEYWYHYQLQEYMYKKKTSLLHKRAFKYAFRS
jgi:hypothetical protein